LDLLAYHICVNWCEEASITSIHDLGSEIIDFESYQTKWIKCCLVMFSELEKKIKENK